MNAEFQNLINDAEDHYLASENLYQFKQQLGTLSQRLEAYELLRDRELEVFQAVADQLQSTFPNLDAHRLNRALEDGLAILRYGAMAMLLNSPVYFQRSFLDCLPERVMAYELEAVEQQMLQFLQVQLSKRIAVAQMSCIHPYLEQVQRALTLGRITEMAVA